MSASRQIRPLQGSGSVPAGNRNAAASAPSSPAPVRSILARIGKYEVETEISGGSLVRVFDGWDRATGRRVILKVLTDVADELRVSRFRREVAAMANFRNAGLISIYELGEHVGMPFAAVEHLGQDHLGHAISSPRPFTLLEKMRVMWQVAEGVQAAHQGGLSYVGLSPAGIALCADGTAKVQDFGIVRLIGDTPGDAAQYEEELEPNRPLDALSDVFSFGVIYYELLTGIYPFAMKGMGKSYGVFVPLRQLAPGCPESLEQLVARAIEPQRELRYQSLDEVQYDAEPILREFERQRAAEVLDEARHWMDARDPDRAMAAVREAIELDPGNPVAERLRGELRGLVQQKATRSRVETLLREAEDEGSQGRFSRAAELLESAARLDGANRENAAKIEQIQLRLERGRKATQLLNEARQAMERKDLPTAEAKVLEALEHEPENPDTLALADAVGEAIRRQQFDTRVEQGIAKAKSLLLLQSFDAAIEVLAQLDRECPGSSLVEQWLGHVREQKQRHERLGWLESQLAEARSLMGFGRFSEAAEILEVLRQDFQQEQSVADLLAECVEAAERASTIAEARAQCDSLCRAERFDKAISVLDLALRAYPDDPDLSALKHDVEQRQREFESAATVRQALQEVQWLLDQDRVDLAVQFLREKSSILPDQAALTSRLAAVEQMLPEWERRRLVQDSLRRAAALEQAQQASVALTVLEEALEACPASPELQTAVERLRVQLQEQERRKKLARWVAEIRQALTDGDTEQADQTLRRVLAVLPEEPALLELRDEFERDKKFREEWRSAQVLVGRRQFEEAERILVRLDSPEHPEVQTLLRTVREARAANEEDDFYKRGREKALHLLEQGQLEQAADLFRNLLSLFPGDAILERDLQGIVGRRPEEKPRPPKQSPAPVVVMPAPVERVAPVPLARSAAEPVPPAWYGHWQVIAGAAFLLLIFAGAGLSRIFRSVPPAKAAVVAPTAATVAALANPVTATVAPSTLIAPPPAAKATEPKEEPAAKPAPKVAADTPPPAARRAFNTATLAKASVTKNPAALVPPPPAATPVFNVDVAALPVGVPSSVRPPAPLPKEAPAPVVSQPAPARPAGGNIQPVRPIEQPVPAMPPLAKERRISGVVTLQATVDKRGAVTNVNVLGGNPLLIPAARTAVSKWRYQPATLNGEPIEAEIRIEVRFDAGTR